MIRPIDIRLNAAHPELPLAEAVTFTGSPSTVLIRGVPPNCGRWAITAVFVAATYPDGSTTTRAAVQSANGVWVATLPATARSGRTENGLRVLADGIDENGAAVTGYILGVADFAVASLGVTPAPQPGETSWQMLYFDAVPSTLRKGDVAKVDGVLKFYNGTAWEPFSAPVTFDDAVTPTSANGVKSSGIWSVIWGALSALPAGFSSLYDWCVSQLAGKASKADVEPLLFAQYYPDGNVKSAAEFTPGIKYNAPDTTNRTITVKPFCNTGTATNDNSSLVGRVVIPPFVDAQGNPYITDDGTRFKVVGVGSPDSLEGYNTNLTAIVAPSTVTSIGYDAFDSCTSLFAVALPAATTIGEYAFSACSVLALVDFGDTPRSSVPSLGSDAFRDVPTSCKIIVPYTQYDAWKAASGWSALTQEFVRHAETADKPATFTTGNLAKFDSNGNPTDSTIPAANVAVKGNIPYGLGTPIVINTASSETVEGETVNYGAATLADRTANIVQVTAATALDELRITFPAATSGKVRDFGLRVEIGTGSAALAAPALVPVAPTGETIKIENADGTIPELADGTATAKGVTLLYFSETAPGVFVVKGEQVEEVA